MRPLTVFRLPALNGRPPKSPGETLSVYLEQVVEDHHGHRMKSESHPVGRAEVLEDGKLLVAISDHLPGRHAIAMLNDDLLDVVLWNGSVRLRVHDEPLRPKSSEPPRGNWSPIPPARPDLGRLNGLWWQYGSGSRPNCA